MDQIQQSLYDMKNRNPVCLQERNLFKAALADCLPNNKKHQEVLLNAFDDDIVQALTVGTDVTFAALHCISRLERDYGHPKIPAFWAVQTWCYLLNLNAVSEALEILRPEKPTTVQTDGTNASTGKEYKIGLGIYRAGTDFPAGELSIQLDKPVMTSVFYKVSKTPKTTSDDGFFKDKIYIQISEGHYLKLYTYDSQNVTFTVKLIKGV